MTIGLLKKANALYKNAEYSEAVASYIDVIKTFGPDNVLANQAKFNLGAIRANYSRRAPSTVLSVCSVGSIEQSGSADNLQIPKFDGDLSTVRALKKLAISTPASNVNIGLAEESGLIFGAFHKYFWNSRLTVDKRAMAKLSSFGLGADELLEDAASPDADRCVKNDICGVNEGSEKLICGCGIIEIRPTDGCR